MSELLKTTAIGTDPVRLDGSAKVRGLAPYAYEHPVDDPLYLYPVQAEIARGHATTIDISAATGADGVVHVLTAENAPPLQSTEDGELAILRSKQIGFRGQYLGAVIATTPEQARLAADLITISYVADDHDVELRADHPASRTPESGGGDVAVGDFNASFAAADITIDNSYSTPIEHNNPMEPHTTIAHWDGSELTLWTSTQGVHPTRSALAPILGLDAEQIRIVSPHVGGGFGSKGVPHADMMLTALAALAIPGQPVKYAVTRQQMFSITGYRAPTLQHIRLGARADGTITAFAFDAVSMSSQTKEFPEEATKPARMMYAGQNRRLTQRVVPLDVPVPSWMRAPGEAPGMVGLEIAMDELAVAGGIDPIELRVRNEPETDPDTGLPFNRRRLLDCLHEGATRFGWADRSPQPRGRRENGWLIGMGVAASTYPAGRQPGSVARIRRTSDGYQVGIGAADLGTGTWTALTQVAADSLGVPLDRVDLQIGDTALPNATVAGGSTGLVSWGAAVIAAAEAFRTEHGDDPVPGSEAQGEAQANPAAETFAMHSFGAQFAQVRIHEATGEIRMERMLGIFSAGRIVNPRTARSQFIGGMTMGLGMALHEKGELDPRFGHVINHDLAEYHVPVNADVPDIEVSWLDENDPHAGVLGARGIGEIGIVGAAAAVANAAFNATGVRVRDLPVFGDAFLPQ
ncbi:xanthine dehydrogenase family protein molybdopterin-binding subunit [Brevibacterium marinum]|uniref:Xanthine dehydrogenase YagR molybdenum-binding subunit n=1 Tax=Brevibacterium marinum TaxID=418643 RepID=A0A846S6E4_9MICO|nr:xanthine dehydrogenase family protein molybdopterin-binding subunit [Brevibacterium marinum]NJC56407.1 xanthine dehydrogenase YagR molybdenum-binding subunit [Brevibacterium marinum]